MNAVNPASSAVNPLLLLELASTASLTPLTGQPDALTGLDAAAATPAATTVQLSGLGRLLSAVAEFQSAAGVVAAQTATPPAALGSNAAAATPAIVTAAAQNLVTAFNTLQTRLSLIGGTQPATAANAAVATANPIVTALNDVAQASFANPASNLATLAQIGITLQPAGNGHAGATLALNANALQTAVNIDSIGTARLLNEVARGFDGLAANYVGINGSVKLAANTLLPALGDLNQLDVGQVVSTGAVFLALGHAPPGASPQQMAAIQQYARVYALTAVPAFEANVLGGLA